MKATEHPDYAIESAYLGNVLSAAEDAAHDLDSRDWRPAMLSDEETANLLRGWAAKRRATLSQLLERPYFGRFDMDPGRVGQASSYYLGQAGLKHPRTGQRLVVDWRAEVAAAFYRPGLQVRLKRRYDIDDRTLLEIHDDPVSGDGSTDTDPVLAQILAGSRGQELRPIVATIQGQQDELIRASDAFMLIQGGAGTGKTVVALHRLAYLLYFHRGPTSRGADLRVAVFGPNRLFLNYVASVLPSLGESDVYQTTFEDWFARWCGRDSVRIPGWEKALDHLLTARRSLSAPEVAATRALLKGSVKMGRVLERFVSQRRARIHHQLESQPFEFAVPWQFREPLPMGVAPADRQRCAREVAQQPPNRAREWVRQWLWPRLRDQLDRRHGAILHDGSRAPRQLVESARQAFDAALEERWPELHFARSYQMLLSDREQLALFADGVLTVDEVDLLTTFHRLEVEDLAPIAYLKLLVDGPARLRDAKGRETDRAQQFDHLVVDEAQDLAPLQLQVLRAHTTGATILGDLAQGISPFRGVQDWAEVERLLDGSTPARRVTLRQSYRSTRQIIAFANQIIGRIDVPGTQPVEPFPRDGEEPQLIRARDEVALVQEIAAILDELDGGEFQTAAVICKTTQETRRIGELLKHEHHGRFSMLTQASDGRSSDVVVLPVYLAKGMDFDVVVVVGADDRQYGQTELDAKLLYVAITRALHRLYILWTGTPSPLLP